MKVCDARHFGFRSGNFLKRWKCIVITKILIVLSLHLSTVSARSTQPLLILVASGQRRVARAPSVAQVRHQPDFYRWFNKLDWDSGNMTHLTLFLHKFAQKGKHFDCYMVSTDRVSNIVKLFHHKTDRHDLKSVDVNGVSVILSS